LETIDELCSWGHRPPLVVADACYGEIGYFRTALTERDIPYIVHVKADTSVHRADAPFTTPATQVGDGRRQAVRLVEEPQDPRVPVPGWTIPGDLASRDLQRSEPGSRACRT